MVTMVTIVISFCFIFQKWPIALDHVNWGEINLHRKIGTWWDWMGKAKSPSGKANNFSHRALLGASLAMGLVDAGTTMNDMVSLWWASRVVAKPPMPLASIVWQISKSRLGTAKREWLKSSLETLISGVLNAELCGLCWYNQSDTSRHAPHLCLTRIRNPFLHRGRYYMDQFLRKRVAGLQCSCLRHLLRLCSGLCSRYPNRFSNGRVMALTGAKSITWKCFGHL
jgi:hypothetical protein